MRCRELRLLFSLSGTKDSADAISDMEDAFAAISGIKVGNLVDISGQDLRTLMHSVYGKQIQVPTAIPGSGTTWTADLTVVIPFRDEHQPGSEDGGLPTEVLADGRAIEITFAAANIFGVGNLITTAGTVRAEAELVHGQGVPQINQIGYFDPNSQTIPVDPGIYKQILVVQSGNNTLTTAEVTDAELTVDGQTVFANRLHEQIVAAYNRKTANGTELVSNAAEFIPLVYNDRSGKNNLTKLPAVETKGQIRLTGSLTAPRIIYWRAMPKDEGTVEKIAQAIGADMSGTYEPQLASKSAFRAVHKSNRRGGFTRKARLMSRYLPGKVRRTITPGN